ncbi:protein US1 [Cercopithecine betaherpesvirus 5]|uniref:Protein US1 n=1 Tax=Simian cytomegalovirus (strain Colburn) TaxID=50292 RepID=G8XTK9_SCMVC|nr:protein US1 [Cercopithecine betaherpesvirus 5]AEV80501.1 protein US1 [Cercopithecine betaherpesvirus 5]
MELNVMSGAVGNTPMRELAWRRVADDSHDLWCACMDWKAHVEYVQPPCEELFPASGGWPAQVEAQWRHQVRVAHDVWCNCDDWRGHALRSRSLTLESNSSRSSTSSYSSAVSCPPMSEKSRESWWKRVKGRFHMRGWWERWFARRRGQGAGQGAQSGPA